MTGRVARRAAERLLAKGLAALGFSGWRRGGTLILAYHNVVPDDAGPIGDRSLHLPLGAFVAQLDLLAECCEVVPLTALSGPLDAGTRPRVVLTFDDASQGAVTLGVEALARRGFPATIFVAPGILGGQCLWWDQLAAATPEGAIPSGVRQAVLGTGHGRHAEALRIAGVHGLLPRPDRLPDVARTATLAELQAATAVPGITLGSHSWSHPNLAAIDPAECRRELRDSLEWLTGHFPATTVPWVAYPYGLESAMVQEAAQDAGYVGGLLISGGWLPRRRRPGFATPRRNVPAGVSADRFALAISGFPGL